MIEKNGNKVAIIDLGTNTFNLLIVELFTDSFYTQFSTKEGVALGLGGITKKIISEDAQTRAIECLLRFKTICTQHAVEKIFAFGTSAIRDAENKDSFIQEVLKQTGIEITVISGNKEAELIYHGVRWSYDFSKPATIMDIGGGSTEFIHANENGIQALKSLNIGVSRVFQTFQLSDPYTEKDVEAIISWFEEQAGNELDTFVSPILIGASGSFETFYEMLHQSPFPLLELKAKEIDINDLLGVLNWTIYSTQAERDEHQFIIPIRRKMGPIAAIKTKWIIEKLNVKSVFVSPCSLKEGVLQELALEIKS